MQLKKQLEEEEEGREAEGEQQQQQQQRSLCNGVLVLGALRRCPGPFGEAHFRALCNPGILSCPHRQPQRFVECAQGDQSANQETTLKGKEGGERHRVCECVCGCVSQPPLQGKSCHIHTHHSSHSNSQTWSAMAEGYGCCASCPSSFLVRLLPCFLLPLLCFAFVFPFDRLA